MPADQVAEDLLRMLGIPAEEARAICRAPLPSCDPLTTAPVHTESPEDR